MSIAPLITVIIPNYNHAKYLPQRIESVTRQTMQDIEILLLDDCSPDNSHEVIAAYAAQDARIRPILNEKNSGNTFAQWNKGISLAKGDYIWLAESDDYADPGFLEKLSRVLDDNPTVGLAFSDSWQVDENGKVLNQYTATSQDFAGPLWQKGFVQSGLSFVQEYMSIRNYIPNASGVLLRRSVLEQVGPAETTFKLVGDWVYWIRILAKCDIAFIPEPLNYFRQHTQNVRSKMTAIGNPLLEDAQMIQALHRHATLGPDFERRRAEKILYNCFYAIIYEDLPFAKFRDVMRELNAVLPGFKTLFLKKYASILFGNKLSGLRQIVGDKLLYKLLKKNQ